MNNKPEYVYGLIPREFKNKNIVKIGKSKQENNKRIKQYPKQSELQIQIICNNCDELERELIKIFKIRFIHRSDIGHEYFEGDIEDMINVIYFTRNNITDIVNQENIEREKIEQKKEFLRKQKEDERTKIEEDKNLLKESIKKQKEHERKKIEEDKNLLKESLKKQKDERTKIEEEKKQRDEKVKKIDEGINNLTQRISEDFMFQNIPSEYLSLNTTLDKTNREIQEKELITILKRDSKEYFILATTPKKHPNVESIEKWAIDNNISASIKEINKILMDRGIVKDRVTIGKINGRGLRGCRLRTKEEKEKEKYI